MKPRGHKIAAWKLAINKRPSGKRRRTWCAAGAAVIVIALPLAQAADPDRRPARPGSSPALPAASRESLAELFTQLEALQAEVRELRGQIDVQGNELERMKAKQRDALADFDKRVREMEQRGGSATAPAPVKSPPTTATPGGTTVLGGPSGSSSAPLPKGPPTAQEQQEYDAAFALLKQGMYDRAAKAFRELVTRNPRSPLADNAQYWSGEANYVLRNFRVAQEEFQKVMSNYPGSPKIPDAMLKMGYSFYELGAFDKAREALNQVVARFPNTTVAKSAEGRLAKMAKEGH